MLFSSRCRACFPPAFAHRRFPRCFASLIARFSAGFLAAVASGILVASPPAHGSSADTIGSDVREMLSTSRDVDERTRQLTAALQAVRNRSGILSTDASQAVNALVDHLAGTRRHHIAMMVWQEDIELVVREAGRDHLRAAEGLIGWAEANSAMGLHRFAEPPYLRAVATLERAVGPQSVELARALVGLAGLYRRMGQPRQSESLYLHGLEIFEARLGSTHPELADNLVKLATLHITRRQHRQAEPLLERALSIYEQSGDAGAAGIAGVQAQLASIGRLRAGKAGSSAALFLSRLSLAVTSGQPRAMVGGQMSALASAYRQRDNLAPEAAIYWAKQSIVAMSERPRSASWRSAVQKQDALRGPALRSLAQQLAGQGRLAEAEDLLAQLKNEELLSLSGNGDHNPPPIEFVGPERQAAETQKALLDEAENRLRELKQLKTAPAKSRTDEQLARMAALTREATDWDTRFRLWAETLPQSLREDPGEKDPTAIPRARSSLGRLISGDQGTVGLHYLVGESRLSVIIATASNTRVVTIDIGQEALTQQVSAFREALQNPARNALSPAQALYQLLIAPLEHHLVAEQATTLVLSLTGVLRYMPFSALHDGERWLVERWSVGRVLLNAPPQSRERSPWQVAGFGLTQAKGGLAALPGVRQELEAIVKTEANPTGLLPGTIALDDAFNRARLADSLSGRFAVVHIGTHAQFKPGHESGSFLMLGDGSRMSFTELRAMKIARIDQLTLSACQTAMGGGENENGVEVEGLAALLVGRGVQSVLASLWSVADASTTRLMQQFYAERSHGSGRGRSESLREAQMRFIREQPAGEPGTGASRAARPLTAGSPGTVLSGPYAHPFYWAGFIVMGDWR